MEIRVRLNGLRMAPRKMRAVGNMIKGKDVAVALDQLENMLKRAAAPWTKLVRSAIANGENTYDMVSENLYIKSLVVDEGVKLRRWLPRAQGRATELQKKTSRITMILDERVAGLKREKATPRKSKKEEAHDHAHDEVKEIKADKKPQIKTEIGTKKEGIVKKMFNRKSV
jgi:large subunit ribosomal protein L22